MQPLQEENKENQIPVEIYTLQKGMRSVIPDLALEGVTIHGHAVYPFYEGPYSHRLIIYYGPTGKMFKIAYKFNKDSKYYEFDGSNSSGGGVSSFRPSDLDTQTRAYFGI